MYFAKWPILIVAGLFGFFRGLFWLCDRYPRTMFAILAFVRGLMGAGEGGSSVSQAIHSQFAEVALRSSGMRRSRPCARQPPRSSAFAFLRRAILSGGGAGWSGLAVAGLRQPPFKVADTPVPAIISPAFRANPQA